MRDVRRIGRENAKWGSETSPSEDESSVFLYYISPIEKDQSLKIIVLFGHDDISVTLLLKFDCCFKIKKNRQPRDYLIFHSI